MTTLCFAFVNELTYRALVWLTYRLAAMFALGLPLVLLFWSAAKREASVVRLLSLYWKVASLMGISMLLLIDERPLCNGKSTRSECRRISETCTHGKQVKRKSNCCG